MVATHPHKVKFGSLWDPIVQCDWHEGIFLMPPAPLPVPKLFSFHVGASFLWLAEMSLLGEPKKNGGTVLADGAALASRGATVGGFGILPHVNVWPLPVAPNLNLLIPLLILNSSSKCVFAVATVRGSDGAIACSVVPHLGVNLACASPAKMPTSLVYTRGSVLVGFTFGDFLYGLALMAIDSAMSFAIGKLTGKLSSKLMKGLGNKSILKSALRPGMNSVLRGIFGRGYSYAEAGKKGFQSLADKYVDAVIKKGLGYGVSEGQSALGATSGSVANLLAGGDERF